MASKEKENAYPTALENCTVEHIVTLLTFKAAGDEKENESNHNAVDGVLSRFESQAANNIESVTGIERWKEKLVQWVRNDKVNGDKLEDDITWKDVADALLGDKVQGYGLKELKDLRRPLKPHCKDILDLFNDVNVARIFQAEALQITESADGIEKITVYEAKEIKMEQMNDDNVQSVVQMDAMNEAYEAKREEIGIEASGPQPQVHGQDEK